MDLEQHLKRQIAFSRATYGPGERRKGVVDHIRKELVEIGGEPEPTLLEELAWKLTNKVDAKDLGAADVVKELRTELARIAEARVAAQPDDGRPANEWVDVVILGLDGLWRALDAERRASFASTPDDYFENASGRENELRDFLSYIPETMCRMIADKQQKNELRDWPDWRTASQDKAIEHVREVPQASTAPGGGATLTVNEHVLYREGDADAPDCIKDSNGDIVLGLCKVCGAGEVQLYEPCQGAPRYASGGVVRDISTAQVFTFADGIKYLNGITDSNGNIVFEKPGAKE